MSHKTLSDVATLVGGDAVFGGHGLERNFGRYAGKQWTFGRALA